MRFEQMVYFGAKVGNMAPWRSWIARRILHWKGWKIEGEEHARPLQKAVFALGPHTSNWDFIIAILVREATGIPSRYLAKHTLFRPPLGWLMRALGGYPVDRSRPQGLVRTVVDIFRKEPHFLLAITPEGTRKKVDKLRSGFYYIAREAQVPIVPVGLDYGKKLVRFYTPIDPRRDRDEVLSEVTEIFRSHRGKYPHQSI